MTRPIATDPQRRAALQALAAAPLSVGTSHLWAAPASTPRLLVVFLRGAYDATSLLVPFTSDDYYAARPTLAIPRPTPNPSEGAPANAVMLDRDWALHPAAAPALMPLWQRGQLAFVPFAGTDNLSRSHFETQDHIELGLPTNDPSRLNPPATAPQQRSGFLNRLLTTLGAAAPTAAGFTEPLPLILRGPQPVPNLPLKAITGQGAARIDARQRQLIDQMYADTGLQASVRSGFASRAEAEQALQAEMTMADRQALTSRSFEGQARRLAVLLRDRYRLGFIDVGGWDTHVRQGAASGLLADRLGELSRGLAALADGLGPAAWRDTTVVVISEFGRTFRENGNGGTDHGHGSTYWVLGGSVRGGRIAGVQTPVRFNTLLQNRDLPVLNDVRSVLGGLMQRQYGLSADQVQQVFPGAMPADLQLL